MKKSLRKVCFFFYLGYDIIKLVIEKEIQMDEGKKKFSWMRLLITIVIVLITAGAVGGSVWYLMDKNAKDVKASNDKLIQEMQNTINSLREKPAIESKANLTNEQIYQEVAKQLSLTKSEITYFRIYGQDKVQYSLGSGTVFMYKNDNTWNKLVSGTEVPSCTAFTGTPVSYMPPCVENDKVIYVDANSQSTNYPISSVVSYIGE